MVSFQHVINIKIISDEPGMVVCFCNPSTQEDETGGLGLKSSLVYIMTRSRLRKSKSKQAEKHLP
jgi:hypothetical protein